MSVIVEFKPISRRESINHRKCKGGADISTLALLDRPLVVLFFLFVSNAIAHILLVCIILILMDIKVPFKKTLLCGICSMVLYTIPVFVVGIFITEPLVARVWIYRLFITINPLSGLIFYFVIKRIFKFSPTRSSIIMHNQLLMEYLFGLFYLSLSDTLSRIWGMDIAANGFFPLDYLVSTIRIALMLALLFTLKAYLKKSRKYIVIPPNYSEKNVKKNVLKTFLAVCVIYTAMVLFRIYLFPQVITPINLSTGFIYLLLFVTILLYLKNTTSQLRNRLLDWEMQASGTYISSLLHTNQEFRAIKHDFYNVLQGYGGYLSIKDYEGLEKYHKKLFATTRKAGDFLSLIEVLRSRIAVYTLLETMAEKAKKVHVSFSINLLCEVTDIVLDDTDLCKVLGIVIDNAIEEAAQSKDKQVNLSFERKNESTVVLVISNTTKGDVDTKQIFKDGYTTKANHTGIGLSPVFSILNTHEGCSLRVNYHENQFTIFLILSADKR